MPCGRRVPATPRGLLPLPRLTAKTASMSNLIRAATALGLIALGFAFGQLSRVGREPLPAPRAAILTHRTNDAAVDEALLSALLEPDLLTRVGQTARVLATIPSDRADSVLATLGRIALAPGDLEVGLAADWLARSDPKAALEWATAERYGKHAWVLAAVARRWAQSDPQGAIQAFQSSIGDAAQAAILVSLLLGWDEAGQPGMVDFLLGLKQGRVPQAGIEVLVRRKILRDGPEATIRWAESLPPNRPDVVSNLKRNAMRRTASALAESDPKGAMEWTATFGEGPYGAGAYRRVAIRTAVNDGLGTMRWLQSLPAGQQRDSALQEAYRTWLGQDRNDALAWLAEEPDAAWLDPAHAVYAGVLSKTEGHEAALAWVEKIDENPRRQRSAKKIGSAWYRREPEKAKAWAEHPPDWVSERTALAIRDPKASKELYRSEREEARAAYRARRAAAAASEGENGDEDQDE